MNHSASVLQFNPARFTRTSALLATPVAWLLLATLPAHAALRVWLNPVSGSWSVTTNWSGGAVPVSGDDTYITNSGTFTVTNDAGASFATLTLGGDSGTQSLNWASGSLNGSTIIGANGVMNLAGSASKNLQGPITNCGQVVWTSGSGTTWYWYGSSGARLENQPGGLLDVQLDGSLTVASGTPVINNAGTFRKSAGSGTLTMSSGFGFTNSGLVSVQSGTLTVANGFTSSGTFDVAGGAAVNLTGGTFNFNPGHTFTGSGYYGVPSGDNVAINGPIINTNFQLSGIMYITNELSGTLWWNSGGQLYGALTVDTNGTLNLVGWGRRVFSGPSPITGRWSGRAGAGHVELVWQHWGAAGEPAGRVGGRAGGWQFNLCEWHARDQQRGDIPQVGRQRHAVIEIVWIHQQRAGQCADWHPDGCQRFYQQWDFRCGGRRGGEPDGRDLQFQCAGNGRRQGDLGR